MTLNLLIVEDDACVRALLTTVVEHYGFHASSLGDGARAMARLRNSPPDLLLLDLLLPQMNGFEVLRELKCTDPEMLRYTIALTGATDRPISECRELSSIWKTMRKPVDVRELAHELTACAEARRETAGTSRRPALKLLRDAGQPERETGRPAQIRSR